jgi:hypothetical protein
MHCVLVSNSDLHQLPCPSTISFTFLAPVYSEVCTGLFSSFRHSSMAGTMIKKQFIIIFFFHLYEFPKFFLPKAHYLKVANRNKLRYWPTYVFINLKIKLADITSYNLQHKLNCRGVKLDSICNQQELNLTSARRDKLVVVSKTIVSSCCCF